MISGTIAKTALRSSAHAIYRQTQKTPAMRSHVTLRTPPPTPPIIPPSEAHRQIKALHGTGSELGRTALIHTDATKPQEHDPSTVFDRLSTRDKQIIKHYVRGTVTDGPIIELLSREAHPLPKRSYCHGGRFHAALKDYVKRQHEKGQDAIIELSALTPSSKNEDVAKSFMLLPRPEKGGEFVLLDITPEKNATGLDISQIPNEIAYKEEEVILGGNAPQFIVIPAQGATEKMQPCMHTDTTRYKVSLTRDLTPEQQTIKYNGKPYWSAPATDWDEVGDLHEESFLSTK